MTKTDKSYAAGILDGEGSISMVRVSQRASRKNGSAYWRITLSVSNCDYNLIRWLNDRWPGSCLYGMNRGKTRRVQHRWTLYGRNSTKFLIDVQPFIIIKTNRVKWALEVNKIQSRLVGVCERYPPRVKARLMALRGLFDNDRNRSWAARGRVWNGK